MPHIQVRPAHAHPSASGCPRERPALLGRTARWAGILVLAGLSAACVAPQQQGGQQSSGIPTVGGIPLPTGLPSPGGLPSPPSLPSPGGMPSPPSSSGDPGGDPGGESGPPVVTGPDMPTSGGGASGPKGDPGSETRTGDPSATAGTGSELPKPVLKPKPHKGDPAEGEGAPAEDPGAYGAPESDQTADGSTPGAPGTPGGKPGEAGTGETGDPEIDSVLGSIDKRIGSERQRILARSQEIEANEDPDGGAGTDGGDPAGTDQVPPTPGERGSAARNTNPSALPDLPSARDQPESVIARGQAPGPIPGDVGDGGGDDVLARQLREAATYEPDPDLRAKLWEEYRRYKQSLH